MRKALLLFIFSFITACAPHRLPQDKPYVSSLPQEATRYMVQRGDTLWSISKKYAVSVEDIKKINKMSSSSKLEAGQILSIPKSLPETHNISFVWPVKGTVIQYFGDSKNNVINKGLNIKTNMSELVRASAGGEVVYSDYLKGWGNTLMIKHTSNFYTVYSNLNDISTRDGVLVGEGETLGKVACGEDGNYVLHFEIRKYSTPHDPLKYLKR